MGEDFQAEGRHACGYAAGDAAEADQAQAAALEQKAGNGLLGIPAARPHQAVLGGEFAGQGQQHGAGVLGDRRGGGVGGVGDDDIARGGGGYGNIVGATAAANDGAAAGEPGQDLGGDQRRATHDPDHVGVVPGGDDLLGGFALAVGKVDMGCFDLFNDPDG